MTKIYFLLLFFCLYISIAAAQKVNHVFVLDTSMSMTTSYSKGISIWRISKKQVCDFINSEVVQIGDTVVFYFFSESLSSPTSFAIDSPEIKQNACRYVTEIKTVNGQQTCLYNTLHNLVAKIKSSGNGNKHIYLITDFKDHCKTGNFTKATIDSEMSILEDNRLAHFYRINPFPGSMGDSSLPCMICPKDTAIVDFSTQSTVSINLPIRSNNYLGKLNALLGNTYANIEFNYTSTLASGNTVPLVFRLYGNYRASTQEYTELTIWPINSTNINDKCKVHVKFIMPAKRKIKINID